MIGTFPVKATVCSPNKSFRLKPKPIPPLSRKLAATGRLNILVDAGGYAENTFLDFEQVSVFSHASQLSNVPAGLWEERYHP